MKTVAIMINEKSTRRHIDYAISEILTNNHRVLLIYIQKNRMVTFSDPYLLFQSAIIYNQVKENEKDNSRILLGKIEKDIKKRIDIEICKLVVMGNEHYKLECVLKTLDADCVVLEKERKFFGKKLGDRITDWGIVVVNVPNVN